MNLDSIVVEMPHTLKDADWLYRRPQARAEDLMDAFSEGWRFLQGQGVQRGHLIGGCFEVLDWLRGTEFWPEVDVWQDTILFLETSEDAPSPEVVKYGLRTYAALGTCRGCRGYCWLDLAD